MDVSNEKITKIEVDLALIGQAMESNNKNISGLTTELKKLADNLPAVVYATRKVNKLETKMEDLEERVSRLDARCSLSSQQVALHSKLLYGTVSILLSSILIAIVGTVMVK